MNRSHSPRAQSRHGCHSSLIALVGATVLTSACDRLDKLLEVDIPSHIDARTLEQSPEHAALLVKGAITDFECALANYIVATGYVADELTSGSFSVVDYDRRTFTALGGAYAENRCASATTGTQAIGLYVPLSIARWTADNAHGLLDGWSDAQVAGRMLLMATASAYAGYAHLLLGEAMCAASIDRGPQLSRAELFALAEAKLTRALTEAEAAGSAPIRHLARLGRARARLNLGRPADAVADASLVPPGFVLNATYAGTVPRSSNIVYWWLNNQAQASVYEAFHHLTVDGVADARVALNYTGTKAHDQITDFVTQNKYRTATSPIPIARWVEAQLIIAEVNGGPAAVQIINTLRTAAGLPIFASDDPDQIRAQVFEERRRELFLEGHRLGDLLRRSTPFTPAAGTPHKISGFYGEMTCFPYPDNERLNNPNLR